MNNFYRNIHPFVEQEIRAAQLATSLDQAHSAFAHLERAHVLGQASTIEHIRVHWHMFIWGLRVRSAKECSGQLLRIVGAATKTAIGFVPHGNTGGANVNPFKRMAIHPELEAILKRARSV